MNKQIVVVTLVGLMVAACGGSADSQLLSPPGTASLSSSEMTCISGDDAGDAGAMDATGDDASDGGDDASDAAPFVPTCSGPANGGPRGYLDPPFDWTYDVRDGQACIAMGGVSACAPCTLVPDDDTTQCEVSSGGFDVYYDPAPMYGIVYIGHAGGEWTPQCVAQ
jgi:hypothetical protein